MLQRSGTFEARGRRCSFVLGAIANDEVFLLGMTEYYTTEEDTGTQLDRERAKC